MAAGERIREEREKRGWTQGDLSEHSGANRDTISGIESGRHRARPSTLRKIAGAFGMEVRELFEASTPKVEPSLFEPDEAAKQAAEILRKASDKELDKLRDELHDQMDELRAQGKQDSFEYGRVMLGILRVFREKQARDRSRALA